MSFQEQLNLLSTEDQARLADHLQSIDIDLTAIDSLLTLKIILQGDSFCGTVPADMAQSLWKLQLAHYKMVGQVLYGSPTATLSSEDKEKYKLVFKIDKGSTNGSANIEQTFMELATKAFEKMEPWQILLAVLILCGTYIGTRYLAYTTEKKKIEAESAKESAKEKERQETVRKMLETHKDIFEAASIAGRDGRIAILKGTSGVTKATIGARQYNSGDIEAIRRRASRVRATCSTEHLCITVDELDARNKMSPTLVVRQKDSSDGFKAELTLNPDDYSDYDKILDLVWDSARFPDKYFWAEITFTKRRDKIISASISYIALTEEDLPQTTEDPED